ncbi:hypothetical protein [Lignipirellula cremea]|uniref:Uncharacterized protein n=1 Tax=Lignipirellula cremea TaxID=2528010 RepID=A0A518DSM7_9BACT|nr:hypothetical protein [Lignipirellula cremea]QDU94843.1 hypothetical protein Pla8534_26510 [Lignipirellula cremea]
MDKALIRDWCDYCEGKCDVEVSHFDTLFMSELGPDELKVVCSYFPNHLELISNISTLWHGDIQLTQQKQRDRIAELAAFDIAEKKPIIQKEGETELLRVIQQAKYTFVDWDDFVSVRESDRTVGAFIEAVGDHVLYELLPRDRKTLALFSALYYFGNSLELRWSLISPLFNERKYRFRSFLDLWTIGGRYAVTSNGVILSTPCEPVHRPPSRVGPTAV